MNRVEIKKRAKEFAFNNKWNIWKAILLYFGIVFVVGFALGIIVAILNLPESLVGILEAVVSLGCTPLVVGLASYCIKLVNGKKVDVLEELISRYKDGSYMNVILVMFLGGLFISLWSLLFVIPGIICAIAYSMTAFILAGQKPEEVGTNHAYKLSKEMMNGHKWEYFVFQLSFILWILGTEVTFGILGIWAVPYMTTANVMWYEELKKISK